MELKVSLFVPPHNPATVLLSRLADVVAQRSGGRLSLRIFHSEQLGGTAAHYDLARTGAADIAYMIHSATPGRFPLTELAHLPPIPGAPEGTAALQELLPEYLEREHSGVKVLFLAANTPMAIHSARPLRSVADLKGLRVGHTGRAIAATLSALGAIPVTVLPLKIRDALASGAIDATSMTYEAALVIRLGEAVCCAFELNANTLTFGLVMNEARYTALMPDLRRVVDEVLGPRAGRELSAMLVAAAVEGKHYLHGSGVTIVEPGAKDNAFLASVARTLSAAFVADLGAPAKAVFDKLKKELA
jgi:TRAP-type C4-dicarboxylate transport system substrate-binding protein